MKRPVVILDFDGLTVDTETVEFLAWEEIFVEHGCELPFQEWLSVVGTVVARFDPVDSLEAQLGRTLDREAVWNRQRTAFYSGVGQAPLMPGILEILEQTRSQGWRLAMATSSGNGWSQKHLAARGILDSFELIVTRDEVPTVKPDPAPYLRVLSQLGLDSRHAIAFEDSRNGIRAAKGAGIYCVAVPNPVTRHSDLSEADEIVPTLEGFPLVETVQKILRLPQRTQPSLCP